MKKIIQNFEITFKEHPKRNSHFLISPIHYEGSTLKNFGFVRKEDFWYAVSISDFTSLNVCITFIHVVYFNSI